ncbi:sn-glycerol-3-phosphate ABC transporter ATP-binding protein UgpC [Photobacterium sp. CAU 1568]|uniref:Sn-glycerol-3-phosphate ABC transporter ATP-binding protein UgpC n=1 Tax=Photobacterium arenosum TaxID=2774143 RepID=A0ABR9BP86_9GAMM|nr:sn-glycerol-3-phosphate ABC transporter ATP-binding protein UgpC [Photobacterium arenosum]MBD8513397.1 sn-glycerol-3-phosphate ABC transporter ATP-binding protein UgpC [Photobacterium arenosum]
MSSLHIKDVNKHYGDYHALKEIDIKIDSGEFLVLVGPSGCGKSTLMNTIAGLDSISDGAILLGDKDVTHLSPKDRDIAMVFQSYALYPSMTVRRNIAFGLEMRKVPQAQIALEVDRVATMLQIDHLLDRKPAELSGGQRQRVAMGRALAREPKIYLFDEPLSNLDAKLRVEMRTEIKKLHQRLKTTIVYVTHDQIEAMTLADRIAVMKDGVLLQLASPEQIYNNPVNMFVAGFMGSPSMNFIRSYLRALNDGLAIELHNRDGERVSIPLPERGKDLSAWVNREVILGLRPEQIRQATVNSPAVFERHINNQLDVVEPTGADTLVVTQFNDQDVTARLDPESHPVSGRDFLFAVDVSKAVLFDPDNEDRIY